MKLKRAAQTTVLVMVFTIIYFPILLIVPEEASAYTPHSPIYINGNGDFTFFNGVAGGSGKPSDPYIMEGWEINASTADGIEIRNTDAHFIIRDTYLHSGRINAHDGIFLSNVTNGRVENVTIIDDLYGIYLLSTVNISITDSDISSSTEGIMLYFNNNTTIKSNIVSENIFGIGFSFSNNVTLMGNTFTKNGLLIGGDALSYYNSHTITTDNLVNGLPLYYYKDCKNLVIDNIPVGQLFVANCTNVRATNLTITDTDYGIHMAFVDGVTLADNNISNSYIGIYLHSCNDITIRGNNVYSHSNYGILLYHSDKANISDNDVFSNYWSNIYLGYLTNATVTGNNISLSDNYGMQVSDTTDAAITGNNFFSNIHYGISLFDATNVVVHHNDFINNDIQASDIGPIGTSWDDGYPSGGNYYSDYTGVDEKSGPNQDQPGSDSIGDTPYDIKWGPSIDRYPFMFPSTVGSLRPPTMSQATLTGRNFENVSLTWSLSPDDGMGFKSVIGYRIYRNTTYDADGSSYGLIAFLPNGTSEFVDNMAGEGDPSNYFYQICAVDLKNLTNCSENQACRFTRPLSDGPNLVSIPLSQSNQRVEIVLQTVEFDKAWIYNSSMQKWRWYMTFKPYLGELDRVTPAEGIWVNVTEQSNLTVAGIVPSTTAIHLSEGWNLVSFPSFQQDYSVADLKTDVAVERVEAFDALTSPYFLRLLMDGDILQTGFGYWVKVTDEITWIVASS